MCGEILRMDVIKRVEHKTFQQGIKRYWKLDSGNKISLPSRCWLLCWAITGMNSKLAKEQASNVFFLIFGITVEQYETEVPHRFARRIRYWKIK